jgi:hypothetical protein
VDTSTSIFPLCRNHYTEAAPRLGGVPPVLVDLATFGSAYLGGHVALNPPSAEDRKLKRIYVATLAASATIGIVTNGYQRAIEADTQKRLQQNETEARNQFSSSLKDVINSNEAI